MKTNYQLKTDEILSSLGGRRQSLLLHSCCGPCSTYVLEYLTQFFDVTLLFYGPNIQPEVEYLKRLRYQRLVAAHFGAGILECKYDGGRFSEAVRGLEDEPEGGRRCRVCFALRIDETAAKAREHGFDYFTTTLTVSPHKNEQLINELGLEAEKRFGVRWLPADFKKRGGYQRSIVLSKELELYRQNYCGCLFSKPAE